MPRKYSNKRVLSKQEKILKAKEKERIAAYTRQDCVAYATLCRELEVPDEDVEDELLRGQGEAALLQRERDLEDIEKTADELHDLNAKDHSDRAYWGRLVELVLGRFPGTERKNGIGIGEIRQKLKTARRYARDVKYNPELRLEVQDVTGWERDPMWNYLQGPLKSEVKTNGLVYCEDVVNKVLNENKAKRRDESIR